MEKKYENIMIAATVEVCSLPLFYLIEEPNGLAFWVVLILLDSFMLKRMDFYTLIELQNRYTIYKTQRRRLQIVECLFMAGLVILAFHSLRMAGALLLNEIVIDVLCFLQEMNEKNDK